MCWLSQTARTGETFQWTLEVLDFHSFLPTPKYLQIAFKRNVIVFVRVCFTIPLKIKTYIHQREIVLLYITAIPSIVRVLFTHFLIQVYIKFHLKSIIKIIYGDLPKSRRQEVNFADWSWGWAPFSWAFSLPPNTSGWLRGQVAPPLTADSPKIFCCVAPPFTTDCPKWLSSVQPCPLLLTGSESISTGGGGGGRAWNDDNRYRWTCYLGCSPS